MSVFKKTQKKVKRPHPDWYSELKYLCNPEIETAFYYYWQRLKFGSKNRAAYLALKIYYSITALNSFRWLGGHLEDYELLSSTSGC